MSAYRRPHVPDVILEQFRLNELPPAEANRVAQLLRVDRALQERVEALERSDEDIARQYPSDWMARRIRERLPATSMPSRWGRQRIRPFVVAAAVAACAVAIAVVRPWSAVPPAANGDRIKGLQPTLALYRRTPRGSETLADGASARAGDLLRVGYISAGRGYGVILSIDGRGVVTLHLPPEGTRAATLRGGGTILLDRAYELDDAPAWERFYFVTADHPFDVPPIVEAARHAVAEDRRAAPEVLPISREFRQSTFSIQKEVQP